MSEAGEAGDAVAVESQAAPETQARALEMGWIPPERYKGDPERFIDADAFVERGETILPIVKKRAEKLEAQVAQLNGQVSRMEGLLKANAEAMAALEDYHTKETRRKVEAAKAGWKAEIKRAAADGDHEALAEATDQLTQLNAEVLEAEKAEGAKRTQPKGGDPGTQELDPVFVAWAGETGWWGKDKRKTHLAVGIAQELQASEPELRGRAFLDRVAEEVAKTLNERPRHTPPNPDKTGGGKGGSTGARGGKSYEDLPSDAKAACEGYTKELVGEGRRYKTAAEWRAAYAKSYFESEV